jgi:hypothetical protein
MNRKFFESEDFITWKWHKNINFIIFISCSSSCTGSRIQRLIPLGLICYCEMIYEGVSKSFWTGCLEWELQMVQLSATRCSCIPILWVSLVSFATITLCVASQWAFLVVSFSTQSGTFWINPCTSLLLKTNSMKQSPSWEVNSYSASQEAPHLLWNLKVHYCVHKTLPLDPILNKMNPVHIFPSYFPKIQCNIIFPSMPRSSEWSPPFTFFNQNFICISSHPCVLQKLIRNRWRELFVMCTIKQCIHTCNK